MKAEENWFVEGSVSSRKRRVDKLAVDFSVLKNFHFWLSTALFNKTSLCRRLSGYLFQKSGALPVNRLAALWLSQFQQCVPGAHLTLAFAHPPHRQDAPYTHLYARQQPLTQQALELHWGLQQRPQSRPQQQVCTARFLFQNSVCITFLYILGLLNVFSISWHWCL